MCSLERKTSLVPLTKHNESPKEQKAHSLCFLKNSTLIINLHNRNNMQHGWILQVLTQTTPKERLCVQTVFTAGAVVSVCGEIFTAGSAETIILLHPIHPSGLGTAWDTWPTNLHSTHPRPSTTPECIELFSSEFTN